MKELTAYSRADVLKLVTSSTGRIELLSGLIHANINERYVEKLSNKGEVVGVLETNYSEARMCLQAISNECKAFADTGEDALTPDKFMLVVRETIGIPDSDDEDTELG